MRRAALAPLLFFILAARPPGPSITWTPQAPHSGETVTFTATAPNATDVAWDFDGDGTFGGATGPTASANFAPGDHVVRLRVVDGRGAASVAEQVVHVATPAPASADSAALVSPFPVVRLRGRLTPSGLRVLLL